MKPRPAEAHRERQGHERVAINCAQVGTAFHIAHERREEGP